MIQHRLTGKRCRAVRLINTQDGRVLRGARGTIRHEMENLGRHLVFVSWDDGPIGYVFPNEIELLTIKDRIAA